MVQAGSITWGPAARGALLAALREQEGAALTRYAAAIVGDWATAEDCVQDSLERAHRWLPRLLARGSFRPEAWMYRTVGNRCRDVLRRRRAGQMAGGPPGEGAGPEPVALEGERAAQVRRVLAALPRRQRLALWLKDGCGLTEVEVGQRLGRTPRSAGVFLVECRKAFRAAAQDLGYAQEWAA